MKTWKLEPTSFAVVTMAVFLTLLGCSPKTRIEEEITAKNLVQAGDPNLVKTVGDEKIQFSVLGLGAFESKIKASQLEVPNSIAAREFLKPWTNKNRSFSGDPSNAAPKPSIDSLLFGMPLKLINRPMVFGSVITQVSDRKNEDLGGLKLADIPPLNVVPVLHRASNLSYTVAVVNCGMDCWNIPEDQAPLLEIPVVGIDLKEMLVILDLSELGRDLDLAAIRKGDSVIERYKSKASRTVRFDYSQGTLVFDVETHLVENKAPERELQEAETVITNRWFLKLASNFNPKFVSRKATPGVGFFMTEKSSDPCIQRWDFDLKEVHEGIRYYLKHVPAEYQKAFAEAFDAWNDQLKPIIGKKVFSYEFISEDDPRNDLLVTGDVRYNILEWDLINKAGYGGLGPSLANQYTGELFQASVLIQGPTIVQIYSKWFKISEHVNHLRSQGRVDEAEKLLFRVNREIQNQMKGINGRVFQMKLGKHLPVSIRSQQPSLEDPMVDKEEFETVPLNYTYEKYMSGYFHDMIAHELGHNLGLRHNFKGNLGAHERKELGKVSRSIMEYLGRSFRYLDDIGEYDRMAVAYGYTGDLPSNLDWYCTDEDAADINDPTKSAECASNDATPDPFGYYQIRLNRVFDLLIARGKTNAPQWKPNELRNQLSESLIGMGIYAASAEHTAAAWTRFFIGGDRPDRASDVPAYVLNKIKAVLCDPSFEREADLKDSIEGATRVRENVSEARKLSEEILQSVYGIEQIKCTSML